MLTRHRFSVFHAVSYTLWLLYKTQVAFVQNGTRSARLCAAALQIGGRVVWPFLPLIWIGMNALFIYLAAAADCVNSVIM